jgi:cold shock protein
MTSDGTVREWRDDEGWGVIDSPVTPGGCWTHFSVIRSDGYRALTPGETVSFDFEEPGQDGFPFRATAVRKKAGETGAQETGVHKAGAREA